jgi:hypothetical protein
MSNNWGPLVSQGAFQDDQHWILTMNVPSKRVNGI